MLKSTMVRWIAATMIAGMAILASAAPAHAARRRSVASPRLLDSLIITTDSAPGIQDAEYLDMGMARPATAGPRSSRTVRATRMLTLRVDRASRLRGGTVTLQAWVRELDSSVSVRINGIDVGAVPRTIDTHLTIGRDIAIRLQVDVSTDAPAGNQFTTIEWEATTNP